MSDLVRSKILRRIPVKFIAMKILLKKFGRILNVYANVSPFRVFRRQFGILHIVKTA